MTRINELIINGKSSADFPFTVYVTANAGFNYARKKNVLTETTYGTGAIKNAIDAYPPIQKPYSIYCPSATLQDMREITTWIADEGKLIASDESDVFYEILDVEVSDAPLEATGGYMLDLVFTTMPFGYEINQRTGVYWDKSPDPLLTRMGTDLVFVGDGKLFNHTNAPMHPRIDVYGTSANEVWIQIGRQEVKLRYIDEKITIESKPFEQGVYDKNGRELNSVMSGDFIEIPKNTTNSVVMSSGIDRIEILSRWAWR
jgi:phage-related protein